MTDTSTNPAYAVCVPGANDPEYLLVAKKFISYFYSIQDAFDRRDETKNNPEVQKMNSMALDAYRAVYRDNSAKTFEGVEILGKATIGDHLDKTLTFKTIKYALTTIDAQPGPPPYVIALVTGQLKTDEDRPLPFSNSFLLVCNEVRLPDGTKQHEITIQNEMFRLGVHNFAA
ncbi:probable nuclear transport factor 2 [Lineus longissimus]|uniref:probable nuclear transport factor 2 n=1 Tax=Lineus longissimus TaxID=88925 RepID=UPI002B4C3D9B